MDSDGHKPQQADLLVASSAKQTTVQHPVSGTGTSDAGQKARRAFKACAHCRSRKAKCDLGPDLNSPHEPPCTRCRREGVECTFLPSRRGGRVPFNSQKRKSTDGGSSLEPDVKHGTVKTYPYSSSSATPSTVAPPPSSAAAPAQHQPALTFPSPVLSTPDSLPSTSSASGRLYSTAMGHVGSLASVTANNQHDYHMYQPSATIPPPIQAADIFRRPRPHEVPSDGSPESFSAHSEGSATHQGPARKKRRRGSGAVDPETLAAASLRNPVDALDLLVLASTSQPNELPSDGSTRENSAEQHEMYGTRDEGAHNGSTEKDKRSPSFSAKQEGKKKEAPPPSLEDFPLVKKGRLTSQRLVELVKMFFAHMHFIFPIIPHNRIPRDDSQVAVFAQNELHLTTVFVVIASRHDRDPQLHTDSWAYLQTLISDIILGKAVSVGAVEALLLLSEYLPRQADLAPAQINAEENRMSWMLVGTAVRMGYMLRLDEKSLLPAKSLSESTDNSDAQELLNRERVAWTYCYLFDRQISIRTGKAFWSRGPGLCFTGGAGGVYPTAARNFPALRFIPELQDDFASLLQAYVELTQIMTSTNDILYPSRDRTMALVRLGEYYKYLDEFTRALESFRVTWEGKRWATYPLTECVWIHFHYLRLTIYAFAFQAHIQRVNWDSPADDGHASARTNIFPAGLVGTPDAKFILEAIDAAADLLRLVTDRLHPGGALPFLPWRFFMMFSYAGVFLLKAVYVEAVAPMDRTVIIRLLKRLIFVLACASTDDSHPGVRYARLLTGLLRAFSKGHESMANTRAPTPTRRNSMEGVMADGTAAPRPDLDFGLGNWGQGDSSKQSELAPSNGFPSLASSSLAAAAYPPALGSSLDGNAGVGITASTPFPMLPFSESQPFHQLASTLDDNALNFDFAGLEDVTLPAAPVEAFNFLLEDQALDFWGSFDADWNHGNGATL